MPLTQDQIDLYNSLWHKVLARLGLRSGTSLPPLGDLLSSVSPPLTTTFAFDPPLLGVGETVNSGDITLTGALTNGFVEVGPPYDLQGILLTAYVTAPDTVQFDLYNASPAPIDLANGIWHLSVENI